MSPLLTDVLILVAKIFLIVNGLLMAAAYLVYFERKISAWIQNRIGPNRVGPLGLFQSFADVFKLLMKEDIIPAMADKKFHFIAPIISIGVAMAVYAVIPFGDSFFIGDKEVFMTVAPGINIGLLFVLAMSSVGVYGITLAGWSSNNKYSLLGGLRSAAQMISYELSMGLSLIGVLMIAGSLNLTDIVHAQSGGKWNIFLQPIAFIIFLVASFAETNRTPFDLPEAEPELVGGYHTEYSGMKFGVFFLAEYANMVTASAMMVLLFLGGWEMPFLYEQLALPVGSPILAAVQFGVFAAKLVPILFFFIWVRWSIPRFRYDQLMNLGWKVMLPLALANILVTGVVMVLLKHFGFIN
ncbi:MAG: NADH-quinone oxidoreductase subunit NuoH [Ignavibacteria bacterium]|nr:NADH-quinone oxidoreductase subunit NuoH [Ignavibacteria bacterium]